MDKNEFELFLRWDIVCVCETWLTDTPCLKLFEKYYGIIFSPAIKNKQKGRASGGLIILYKHGIKLEVIDTSYLWLIVKIVGTHSNLIIGNIYINPKYNLYEALKLLRLVIDDLQDQGHSNILMGGDFNSRIADGNFMDIELAEDFSLLPRRCSLDLVLNERGETLIEFMEEHGFIVLNGRTSGDIPGQFTFNNKAGMSVVDLVWITLDLCSEVLDLCVSQDFLTSDHFAIQLRLNFQWQDDNLIDVIPDDSQEETTIRYTWCEEKAKDFIELINSNYVSTQETDQIYYKLRNRIYETASQLKMTHQYKSNRQFMYNRNPWYNQECRNIKNALRKQYRKWFQSRDNAELLSFHNKRKQYFWLCKAKKKEYEENFKKKLRDVKNAGDFWKAVFNFKPKKPNKCQQISMAAWNDYLQDVFPLPDIVPPLVLTDVTRDQMDSDFCIGELNTCIAKLKNGKSPGPDNLLNEYFKSLGESWRQDILRFLNFLFEGGNLPADLTKSYFFMLHKKGDPKDPNNFRCIALLNGMLKLATQLLAQRVLSWCETNNILIEAQCGFRPGRGCVDNLFTLSSVVSMYLIRGRKVYAAFIDYKSAFLEVDHHLLKLKMFNVGISRKVISMFQKFYDTAESQIRVGTRLSDARKITKGCLQGDSASPLIFLVFLNDLEEYIRNKGLHGLSIDHTRDLLLLLYADDLILFATDKVDLQRKLNALHSYCLENKMMVNVSKSKVVIFRRGGRVSASDVFYYDNNQLEICSDYNYLGVLFSSHGVFHKAAEQALSRGRVAVGTVRQILVNSKTDSLDSRVKLFHAIVRSTLLYGSEVWSLRYEDTIEKCQTLFYKSVYCLPKSTASYMLRLEMGVVKLFYHAFSMVLEWWLKLLKMPDTRYPRLCYDQLVLLDQRSSNVAKYNWCTLLKNKLVQLEFGDVWEAQSIILLEERKEDILLAFYSKLVREDWRSVLRSTYNVMYREIKVRPENPTNQSFVSPYLQEPVPIERSRIASQLRMCGKNIRLYVNRMSYVWDQEELCSICNQMRPESVQHFLLECPHYAILRRKYLQDFMEPGNSVQDILIIRSKIHLNNLYYYVQGALKLRAFLRNEW